METLRVGILTDMCGPVFGGGYQTVLWEIARRLAKRHTVRIFTSLPQRSLEVEGVELVRAFPMGPYPDRSGTRGRLQPAIFGPMLVHDPLGPWRPDALIVEAMPFSHLPFMGRWVRKRSFLRLLKVDEAWVHYSPFRGALGPASLRLSRWMLSQGLAWSDAALPVSRATAEALRSGYGYREVLLFSNGMDVPRLESLLPSPAPARDLDVITVGRLVPIKRQAELLRALGILASRGWKGRAAVVGEGPLAPVLRGSLGPLGLEGRVDIPGRVSEARRMEMLSRAKVFVLPSEREGFSLATLEAMLVGALPVVGRPQFPEVFGAGDLVEEGRTGYSYPVGDPEALAHVLERALADEGERTRLASAARARARDFDWDGLVAAFEVELRRRVDAVSSRGAGAAPPPSPSLSVSG